MIIEYLPLKKSEQAQGVVVVVDVIRAFTTAAFAFAANAPTITVASTVAEALALRRMIPGSRVMGEVGGIRVPEFDYSNSPSELLGVDFSTVPLIQRTSAGTQGLVRATGATILLASSLVVASATANYLRRLGADKITFIASGLDDQGFGDEDLACAEFIAALIQEERPDPQAVVARVQGSRNGLRMVEPGQKIFPPGDQPLCLEIDRFNFAMRAHRREGRIIMGRFERWGTGALRRWNV